MKVYRKILFLVLFFVFAIITYAQKWELNSKEKLCIEEIKQKTKSKLDSARIVGSIRNYQDKIIVCIYDSIGYITDNYKDFSNHLIYTKDLRDRLLELLNNEWKEWELEIVAKEDLAIRLPILQEMTTTIIKIDTVRTQDEILDSLQKQEYIRIKQEYHDEFSATYYSYAKLASYINDSRYVLPIKNNFYRDTAFFTVCLARMGIEPYYTQELNELKILAKNKEYWSVKKMVYETIRTQEGFRVLSGMLLTDQSYNPDSEGNDYHFYYIDAAKIIFEVIANKELMELFSEEERIKFWYPYIAYADKFPKEYALRLYKWMQDNYGNYKIRPF